MNQLAILRRHLALLRLVQPPFSYPCKKRILSLLEEEDLEAVSSRTFERDILEIESYYGIRVKYSHRHRGYFLDQPADEDLSNFRQFLQLLERSERLAFITHSSDALKSSRYLLLEESHAPHGTQLLPVLWEALRTQRQLSFHYQTFQQAMLKQYLVDPLVLLEYRNRWYLAAWDNSDKRFKTFGLERLQEPQLSRHTVQTDRRPQFLALKQDALGVFISPDQEVAEVVLRIDSSMAPYIKTVPIHHSQNILEENASGMTVSLRIILNPELESAILSYGEHVEVLEPIELRERMRERVQKTMIQYHVET